jgi:hypothetical protein
VVSLLDQPPLDLDVARARLATLRAAFIHRALAGALVEVAGLILLARTGGRWAAPLLLGGAVAFVLAALSRGDRDRLLVRLVAQDDAWSLAEVRGFASRLLSPRRRARLARGLALAAAAGEPGLHEYGTIRPERAMAVVEELQWLAGVVADASVPLHPAAAALCRRLLCDAALSPLYNPRIPERDVRRLVAVIRRGVGATG